MKKAWFIMMLFLLFVALAIIVNLYMGIEKKTETLTIPIEPEELVLDKSPFEGAIELDSRANLKAYVIGGQVLLSKSIDFKDFYALGDYDTTWVLDTSNSTFVDYIAIWGRRSGEVIFYESNYFYPKSQSLLTKVEKAGPLWVGKNGIQVLIKSSPATFTFILLIIASIVILGGIYVAGNFHLTNKIKRKKPSPATA